MTRCAYKHPTYDAECIAPVNHDGRHLYTMTMTLPLVATPSAGARARGGDDEGPAPTTDARSALTE